LKSSLYGAGAEYALHSLLVIAAREAPVSVRDLARFQDLPGRFLAKVFSRLEKAGIVRGIEGIGGGFVLAAVDPNRTLFACAEIRRHCALFGDEAPAWSVTGMCRIHLFMREAEGALQAYLGSKTLAELSREFEKKAPPAFMREAEAWFQQRRDGRSRRSQRTENPGAKG
jgi:Rrf2 family protein